MDVENTNVIYKREIEDIIFELDNTRIYLTDILYIKIIKYILEKEKYKEDQIPILEYLCVILKEREKVQNFFFWKYIRIV